jgi:hypothetical protein
MTDPRLADLFAEGTAPERDAAFVARVTAGIGRARLGARLLTLALQAAVTLTLAIAVFVAGRLIEPALMLLADQSPRFMGVPVPVMLGVLLVGLALYAPRRLGRRMV